MGVKEVDCSFMIPVVRGKICLVKRNTEPHKGSWCAVGGKADAPKAAYSTIWERPQEIEKMGGHRTTIVADRYRILEGKETVMGTAVRETAEELYSRKKFPDEFELNDFSDLSVIGSIDDCFVLNGVQILAHNYFMIGRLNNLDFSPSPREIADLRPLCEIGDEPIVPITRTVLAGMRYQLYHRLPTFLYRYPKYNTNNLLRQLNCPATDPRKIDRARFSWMAGVCCLYTRDKEIWKSVLEAFPEIRT